MKREEEMIPSGLFLAIFKLQGVLKIYIISPMSQYIMIYYASITPFGCEFFLSLFSIFISPNLLTSLNAFISFTGICLQR